MVDINVTITMRSPLHISSGFQQGTLAQRGLLKDHTGWPYIPASALKGRWRHAVEQVAGTLPGERVCVTHHDMCRQEPCAVCQIFGSPWQRGRVRFVRLALSGPEEIVKLRRQKAWPKTSQRTGVAINRRRRVAQDDFLYQTELFMPGLPLAFSGQMQGEISQAQAGLLLAGLRLMPALGKGKSGGLGWIEAEATITTGDGTVWTTADLASAVTNAWPTGEVAHDE